MSQSQSANEFWCEVCRIHIVNSEDRSTGDFLSQWGHIVSPKDECGKYVRIEWAVCSECLSLNKEE